jgi:TolA-binding protein
MVVLSAAAVARGDAAGDYNVALEFYKQERWDLAARGFREFLTRYSNRSEVPSARLYLGQALVNQRKFDEARQVFRDYVTAHAGVPEVAVARFRVGESSYFLQDYEAARRELSDYLAKHPEHELALRAQHYLGQTQLRLGDPKAAAATLAAVVKQSNDAALGDEAKYGLAQARERLGEREPAANLYRELTARQEGAFAADAQFRLGALAFEAKDYAGAVREFAAVSTRFPSHRLVPGAELNAGYAEFYLDRMPQAIEHLQKAKQDPAHAATAGFWIGLSYKQAGDFAAAVQELQSTYERDPQQTLADKLLFHWADCELRREQYAKARELFLQLTQRWPDGDRADDSLHLATEAALRAGDLAAAEKLNQQFEQKYATGGLRVLQQLLAGRIQLARGDENAAINPDSPVARQHFERAAELFAIVASGSDVPQTKLLARVQLGRAYQRLKEPQKVVEALQPLVQEFRSGTQDPELIDALLLQGESLAALQKYAEVVAVAELYLSQPVASDRQIAALAMISSARAHLGQRDELAATLARLAAADKTSSFMPRTCYESAEIAYAAKEWDWAADLFQRTIAFGRDSGFHAAALSGLGYSRHEAGQHAEAAATFGQIVEEHGDDRNLASTAAHMRGLSLQMAGKPAEAAAAYEEGTKQFALPEGATASDVDYEVGFNAYRCAKGAARVHRETGETGKSDAAYDAAYRELKKQPADRQAELDKLINEWALLSYEAKLYDRSDELFALLIRERPESDLADDARLSLAESHFFADRLPEARRAFEELLSDAKADEFVQQRAGSLLLDILAKQEDWPDLLKSAEAFHERFPGSAHRPYAQYRIGEAALQSGAADRAVTVLSALLRQRGTAGVAQAEWFPSVSLLLAEAHFQQKQYKEAERVLAAFRRENPESPYLYQADEVLGRCYQNRAMFPDARAAFTRVIDSEAGRRTETAAKAQFHIAETYLIEKNYDSALAEYYKVYVNYRFPAWQAPALFQAGQCDEQQERWTGAMKSYETLIREFPESEFVARATERLQFARRKVPATETAPTTRSN